MNIINKTLIGACGLFSGLHYSACGQQKIPNHSNLPNIVLIMADDMGYECLGCNGSIEYKTPSLDRLAAQGIRFGHCYSQPLCTPSRVKIMTGKYNFRNYEDFGYLNPDQVTFGNILKDAGYSTCIAGKWQLNGLNRNNPGNQDVNRPYHFGFNEYCLWNLNHSNQDGERYANPLIVQNGKDLPRDAEKYGPDIFSGFVCDFINRNAGNPFFVYYPMVLVHAPFVPTPDSPEWKNVGQRYKNNTAYFADMVAYVDKIVLKIENTLKANDVWENTILIFTGDNGTHPSVVTKTVNGDVKGGKGYTINTGNHVPMIISWPKKIKKGRVFQGVLDFSDILPTLADAAKISPSRYNTDGKSFLSVLRGDHKPIKSEVFIHYTPRWGNFNHTRWMMDGEYKLYRDGRFYNTLNDPKEEIPLIHLSPRERKIKDKFESILQSKENEFPFEWNNTEFNAIIAPDKATYAINPRFHFLRFGEVKPAGWIKEQMSRDLKEGFAGRLDKLAKEASRDIFASGRNKPGKENAENSSNNYWWNGETEGNWRTGFIMLAYLSGNSEAMKQADAFVSHVLAAQDENGYLGINSVELQYSRNGELWTQTCLLRGLLAYSELSGKPEILKAVERSVNLTINTYGPCKKPVPLGQTHDLTYVDVLEHLYEITGDTSYRDFALWLYDDYFSRKTDASTSKSDLMLSRISNPDVVFTGHGVHTFEHLRVPAFLWLTTGREDLEHGWHNAMNALEHYIYPSGAAVSQERIEDLPPDPTNTLYEYCAIKEISTSMESALQKTGKVHYGDCVEQIWFNAAQGARLPDGRGITYLSNDNRFKCDRMTPDGKESQPRNKFSPTHADVAVCCNPFATQIAPYYVKSMWMRTENGEGLSAMLYGPCQVTTDINNIQVTIKEKTNYPFENTLEFVVNPAKTNQFPLYFRNPSWSQNTTVICKGAKIVHVGDYCQVEKKWEAGDVVKITFNPLVQEVQAVNKEVALQFGALLFALPFPSRKKVTKSYPEPGFEDFELLPTEIVEPLSFIKHNGLNGFGFKPKQVDEGANLLRPFDKPVIKLTGKMVTPDGKLKEVDLVPLGNAFGLRQVTFPIIQK